MVCAFNPGAHETEAHGYQSLRSAKVTQWVVPHFPSYPVTPHLQIQHRLYNMLLHERKNNNVLRGVGHGMIDDLKLFWGTVLIWSPRLGSALDGLFSVVSFPFWFIPWPQRAKADHLYKLVRSLDDQHQNLFYLRLRFEVLGQPGAMLRCRAWTRETPQPVNTSFTVHHLACTKGIRHISAARRVSKEDGIALLSSPCLALLEKMMETEQKDLPAAWTPGLIPVLQDFPVYRPTLFHCPITSCEWAFPLSWALFPLTFSGFRFLC